jgi:predicted ferric reductase
VIRKNNIGQWVFWTLAFLAVPLTLISPLQEKFNWEAKSLIILSSNLFGMLGFSMFALSFLLSARIKWMERYFGGLDKMYHTHHIIARYSFLFMLLHALLLVFRGRSKGIEQVFTILLPLHSRFSVDLGSYALIGVAILLIFTFIIKLPYDKWKKTHKLIGIFFILSVFHIFLLKDDLSEYVPLMIYVVMLTILGIAAYIYKTLVFDFIKKKYTYIVSKVDRLSDRIMEITMEPQGTKAHFIPGQYYFFSFVESEFTRESHPFTLCNVDEETDIRIIVKSLGDYTEKLYNVLKPGVKARLEGPYGTFYYGTGRKEQIWIGGGVGMAPFISWARELKAKPYPGLKADMYYCVNTKNDAVNLHDFKVLESDGFKIHLICADTDGFLKAKDIENLNEREIYICGPKGMRKSLLKGLDKQGVKKDRIHYEDFDFI